MSQVEQDINITTFLINLIYKFFFTPFATPARFFNFAEVHHMQYIYIYISDPRHIECSNLQISQK